MHMFIENPRLFPELHSFLYELEMLNKIQRLWEDHAIHPEHSFDQNSRLESFLLHARNLIIFLSCETRYPDDLVCRDFLSDSGTPIECKNIDGQKILLSKINKHLAHISKERNTLEIKWKHIDIRNQINVLAVLFLERCAVSYFGSHEEKKRMLDIVRTW